MTIDETKLAQGFSQLAQATDPAVRAAAATLQSALSAPAPAPTPTPTPTVPTNKEWGIQATSNTVLWPATSTDLGRDLDLIKTANAKWTRIDVNWGAIETSKGTYNWGPLDTFVNGALQRGLRILGMIGYTPGWARPSGTTDKAPPTNIGDYVNFCQAVVKRYLPLGLHYWEIWNEPNIPVFWQPKPNVPMYTNMLKQAYTAIHAIDPTATVMNAGFAPAGDSSDGLYVSPRTFLTQMYTNGVHGSLDAFAIHPYAYNYGIDAVGTWNQWQSLPTTRQILVNNGDSGLKVWATEYGAPTGTASQAVTETGQAQYVTAAWGEWTDPAKFGNWTGPLIWYALRDTGTTLTDVEQNFGLVRHDFSLKPAYATFQQLPK